MKTQTKILLIRIAGVLSILYVLFHVCFYWIFKWSEALNALDPTNKAILLTLHVAGILILLYSVIVSLGYTRQLIETTLGKSLLLFFVSFYLVRIVCEFGFFGFSIPNSFVIIVICLIPAICFGLPVFYNSK